MTEETLRLERQEMRVDVTRRPAAAGERLRGPDIDGTQIDDVTNRPVVVGMPG